MSLFEKLDIQFDDPPRPPKWCKVSLKLLGAYLAGIIDGDGSVKIRRPRYPQCVIRIASGSPQIELKDLIEKNLKCGVSIRKEFRKSILEGRIIEGSAYMLEFLVSSKTYKFFQGFVLPEIQLGYKKRLIQSYISSQRFIN